MTVHGVDDVVVEDDRVSLTIAVSKGTYVRSLAEELGRRLGVPAHLAALRRLSVGELHVDDPRTVTGLRAEGQAGRTRVVAIPTDPDAPRQADSGARIEVGLHPPWHGLPMPVRAIAEVSGARVWTALGHGQRVQVAPGELDGPLPEAGLVAIRAAGPALVVCELDDAGILVPRRRVAAAGA
jgi:hypothetical protein